MADPLVPLERRVFAPVGNPAIDRASVIYDALGDAVMHALYVARLSVEGMLRAPGVLEAIDGRQDDTEFVKREIDRGFPITWGQTAIAIWGQLEAFAEDFAAVVIEFEPELLTGTRSKLPKLAIPIGEFLTADDERYLLIVRHIQQKVSTGTRGVNQFENVFDYLDLTGPMNDNVSAPLYELSGVRNVLAHRRGVADRKFVNDVKHFGAKIGDPVKIDLPRAMLYGMAALAYGALVLKRYSVRKAAPQPRLDYIGHLLEVLIHNLGVSRAQIARGAAADGAGPES